MLDEFSRKSSSLDYLECSEDRGKIKKLDLGCNWHLPFVIAERRGLHPWRQRPRQRHQRLPGGGQRQASQERWPATFECWRETHLVKWGERGVLLTTPAASTDTPHHQELTLTLTTCAQPIYYYTRVLLLLCHIKSEGWTVFKEKLPYRQKEKSTPTTSLVGKQRKIQIQKFKYLKHFVRNVQPFRREW